MKTYRMSLHTLFRIFKGLIMLNEPSLIEACLSDAFFLDTMGYILLHFFSIYMYIYMCVYIYMKYIYIYT